MGRTRVVPLQAVVADETANRELDTIYQNTTGRPRLVIVGIKTVCTLGQFAYSYIRIGSATPPTTTLGRLGVEGMGSLDNLTLHDLANFIVPPFYYYRILRDAYSSGTQTIADLWIEVGL